MLHLPLKQQPNLPNIIPWSFRFTFCQIFRICFWESLTPAKKLAFKVQRHYWGGLSPVLMIDKPKGSPKCILFDRKPHFAFLSWAPFLFVFIRNRRDSGHCSCSCSFWLLVLRYGPIGLGHFWCCSGGSNHARWCEIGIGRAKGTFIPCRVSWLRTALLAPTYCFTVDSNSNANQNPYR